MKVLELLNKLGEEIQDRDFDSDGEEYNNDEGIELRQQLQAFTAFLGSWGLLEEEVPLVDPGLGLVDPYALEQ